MYNIKHKKMNKNTHIFVDENIFENFVCKLAAILSECIAWRSFGFRQIHGGSRELTRE